MPRNSKIENVIANASAPLPAEFIFGREPAHTWCYYYQQAELAIQNGAWEDVIEIGEEVNQLDLQPKDRIEWTPFLQAYAIVGDEKAFETITEKIEKSPFVRREICNDLLNTQEMGAVFTPEIQSLMDERVCRGQEKSLP